jgi:hypothetical protein
MGPWAAMYARGSSLKPVMALAFMYALSTSLLRMGSLMRVDSSFFEKEKKLRFASFYFILHNRTRHTWYNRFVAVFNARAVQAKFGMVKRYELEKVDFCFN